MSALSGMTVQVVSQGGMANDNRVVLAGSGTYTAADFSLGAAEGIGFTPTRVIFENLTDRVKMEHTVASGLDGGSNAKGIKTVAAGTRTYEATGLSVSGKNVTITVATALLTDNDDFLLICER